MGAEPMGPAAAHHLDVDEALSHLRVLQSNGVRAVLVDHTGHPMGVAGPLAESPSLGPLGSGLLSVSDSLVRQLGGSWADHVVVTSTDRQVVILPAGGSVAALVVVAPRQMPLGPLLWAARRCCAHLAKAAEAGNRAAVSEMPASSPGPGVRKGA